ncbi:MAG: hypothetical protein P8Z37_00190 [Acidobacteriota bacterium]
MSVQPKWKERYGLLKEYTESNPEIIISTNEVSIPKHLRDTFYNKFDAVRDAVVEDRLNVLPLDVQALRDHYVHAETEVTALLNLDRIDIPVDLSSFLHDPRRGLVRVLYHRLFEFVQKKINEDEFEQLSRADIDANTAGLFRLGYEPWAALEIVRLLEPDRAYSVGLDEDFNPFVSDLKEIAFGRQFHHPAKRIPEFVLHSTKLDTNVAVKMPLAREVDTYYIPFEPRVKPKKRTGDTSLVIDTRTMFLSVVPDLKKIPVFADIHARTTKSPDVMVGFATQLEAEDPGVLAEFKKRVDIMQPKLGGSLVVINPPEDAVTVATEEGIEKIPVGFDSSKLNTVIDKLSSIQRT